MKRPVSLLLFLTVLLSSCSKDNDPCTSQPGKKLIREERKKGPATLTLTYEYGTDGKLFKLHQESTASNIVVRQGFTVSRNSKGMIERIVYLTDGIFDSLTINISSIGQQYTKAVQHLTTLGSTLIKTTEFVYNNAGQIVQTKGQAEVDGDPHPATSSEFTYASNNLVAVKTNHDNNLLYQYEYAYDNYKNPLPFGNEWILYSLTFANFYEHCSVANAVKQTYKLQDSFEQTTSVNYTYNTQYFPVTATATTPVQPATTVMYTYE